ncbi:MAG TPA: alpha/beta fold hydrolase, partial [Solirubrobacterales bacterium]|nr:alpha/beta fold hydrolase [Solirubrobacterales bacterium]
MRRTLPLLLVALTMLIAAAPARAELPVIFNGIYGYAQTHPTASPPGANDWSCKPTAAHPQPVVLVHGTFADMSNSWQAISPLLKNKGYCVFALNYGDYNGSGAIGVYGVDDIPTSAKELDAFVDKVLAATGAAEVDIVGHSQGGMMPRYYIKFLGGAKVVDDLVGLAPSNHETVLSGGTALALLTNPVLDVLCYSCNQQAAGSPFLRRLNAGDETPGKVS